ncbi:MAG: fructokinase [Rhodobiaceae bacterium]|nr:MAG: fructokinase [Rhodobiaceae bacterium]
MRLGVDLGGTKIEAVLMSSDGTIVERKRVSTPQEDYGKTVRSIADLVAAISRDIPTDLPVGIGIPGTLSPATGLIKNANSTWLINRPLDKDLMDEMGRNVRLANDADCFALSEATDGAGTDANSVFGVILGTGVGGGIVIAGNLVSGPNAIAGEWGHNPLPWPTSVEQVGPACYCGRQGCIETWLSGPALERDGTQADGGNTKIESALGLAEMAAAGEPAAISALDRYTDRLARALASVINIIDPEVIVLGGGLSNIASLYEQVPQRWGDYVFSDTVATKLRCNQHGDSSGVRGAAWLWPDSGP